MGKYLDSAGVQQFWKAVVKADNAIKTIINELELSYDPDSKRISLSGNDGELVTSFDASVFVKDGMLENVEIISADTMPGGINYGGEIYNDSTKFIKFVWNTDAGTTEVEDGEPQKKIIFLKVSDISQVYTSDDTIEITNQNIIKIKDVPTDKISTENNIHVIGGPLADLLNSAGITSITKGTDMQTLLVDLFYKELWPTIDDIEFNNGNIYSSIDNPSFTLEGENDVLEVGTQVTISGASLSKAKISMNNRGWSNILYGYSADDDNTKISSNTYINAGIAEPAALNNDNYSMSRTFNGFNSVVDDSASASVDYAVVNLGSVTATVGEGENSVSLNITGPSASIDFESIPEYYACSNVGNTHNEDGQIYAKMDAKESITITSEPATNSITKSLTGKRFAYVGAIDNEFNIDSITSDNIRSLNKSGYEASSLVSLTAPTGNTSVIIAFPSTWGELKKVKDNNALGAIITDNFIVKTVQVEGANGYTPVSYKVYIYKSKVKLGEIDYSISIA